MERRLVAILVANVVGYRRLIGADEARSRGRNGIALVAVLWVLVLLSIIAAGFLRETSVETQVARNLIYKGTTSKAGSGTLSRRGWGGRRVRREPGQV